MPHSHDTSSDALVLVDDTNGITVVPQLAELRRLNWFDGKLLRADDLRVEQDHVRALVRRANAAGGWGVVHGFGASIAADGRLHVSPGVAVDPSGRSLLLHADVAFDVGELIARTGGVSAAAQPAGSSPSLAGMRATTLGTRPGGFRDSVAEQAPGQPPVAGQRWHVVTVGWAEGLCGNEDVHGNLCDCACTTSTDRSWRLDGLVFRAWPIAPGHPLPTSAVVALDGRHERSRLASALFADELEDAGSMVFGAGLRSGIWCATAAAGTPPRDEVPLAVISRSAAGTSFLDVWTVCRQRIEPPPQRYWAGRLAMRPWNVFLAQVLQFQCQLDDMLGVTAPDRPPGFVDPCSERQRVLEQAIAELGKRAPTTPDAAADAMLASLTQQMQALAVPSAGAGRRVLIDGGIVELPPAGYLPVDPAGPTSVQDQVRALLGEGVELRFCTTRADALAREFELAQHLNRISLLRGLDDPRRREQVQIIVPDADVQTVAATGWHGFAQLGFDNTLVPNAGWDFTGAGRVETAGELALRWAGTGGAQSVNFGSAAGPATSRTVAGAEGAATTLEDRADAVAAAAGALDEAPSTLPHRRPEAWLEATVSRDPAGLLVGEGVKLEVSADMTQLGGKEVGVVRGSFLGEFTLTSVPPSAGGLFLRGTVSGIATRRRFSAVDLSPPESHVLNGVEAVIQRSVADAGTTTTLTLRPVAGVDLTASIRWRGAAESVEVGLSVDLNPAATSRASGAGAAAAAAPARVHLGPGGDLIGLRLDAMPASATPGHPDRAASEEALAALDGATGELGYASARLRKLFPEQSPGTGLRATRDYVLFLRDAVLACGAPAAAPAAPATTRFAVWGRVQDTGSGDRTLLLGEVVFREDTTEVVPGAQDVASVWNAAATGGEMQRVDVLAGAPGGDALSKLRAERVATVLAGVTPRAPGFVVAAPATLPVARGGADGVMLVHGTAKLAEVPGKAVPVALVLVADRVRDEYLKALASDTPRVRDALKLIMDQQSDNKRGVVDFADGSGAAVDPEALKVLGENFLQTVQRAFEVVHVISVKDDEAAGDVDVRRARGTTVVDAIANNLQDIGPPVLFVADESGFAAARAQGVMETTIIAVLPQRAPA